MLYITTSEANVARSNFDPSSRWIPPLFRNKPVNLCVKAGALEIFVGTSFEMLAPIQKLHMEYLLLSAVVGSDFGSSDERIPLIRHWALCHFFFLYTPVIVR